MGEREIRMKRLAAAVLVITFAGTCILPAALVMNVGGQEVGSLNVSVSASPDWIDDEHLSSEITVMVMDSATYDVIPGALVSFSNDAGGEFTIASDTTDGNGDLTTIIQFNETPDVNVITVSFSVSCAGYADEEGSITLACDVSSDDEPATQPSGDFFAEHKTFIYLVIGLVLDAAAVAIVARKMMKSRNVTGRAGAAVPSIVADGQEGHAHVSGSEIVAWWRAHAAKSKDSPSRKLIEGAKLVGERRTTAAMAQGSWMYSKHTTEVKYYKLHDLKRVYANPTPTPPAHFTDVRQEYPTRQQPVPCSHCSGTGKKTCITCQGTTVMRCMECYGSGRVKCKECNGLGGKEVVSSGKSHYENGILVSTAYKYWDPCPVCHREKTVTCGNCAGAGKLPCSDCSLTGKVDCENCEGHGQVNRVDIEVWTYTSKYSNKCFGPGGAAIRENDFEGKNVTEFTPDEAESGFLGKHGDADGHVKAALASLKEHGDKPKDGLVKEDYRVKALPVTGCEMQYKGSRFSLWGVGGPTSCRVREEGVPERSGAIKLRVAAPFVAGLAFALIWIFLLYWL